MSRSVNILRVFVASPNDVEKERVLLKSIVDAVNKEIGSNSGTQLELVKYETDVSPGAGKSPQDVINKKIDDDYDIFIGIMWKKFGTATDKAASGTVEEFERAYTRHTILPDAVKIMFYFKTAPVKRDEIEPEQIRQIDEFRNNLGGKGILWDRYKSISDFEQKVRRHLHDAIRTFEKEQKGKDAIKNNNKNLIPKEITEFSEDSSPWKLLFEHDENGNQIEGDINYLIKCITMGCPIRLRVHHSSNNIQLMDAPLLSIENGVVHASDISQISKTRDKSGNYIYQNKLYHYYLIANSKGYFHARRIYMDGAEHKTTNSKRRIAWFGLIPSQNDKMNIS